MPKRAGSLKNTTVRFDPPGLCLVCLPERRRASDEKVFRNSLSGDRPKTEEGTGGSPSEALLRQLEALRFLKRGSHQSDALLDLCQLFRPLPVPLLARFSGCLILRCTQPEYRARTRGCDVRGEKQETVFPRSRCFSGKVF